MPTPRKSSRVLFVLLAVLMAVMMWNLFVFYPPTFLQEYNYLKRARSVSRRGDAAISRYNALDEKFRDIAADLNFSKLDDLERAAALLSVCQDRWPELYSAQHDAHEEWMRLSPPQHWKAYHQDYARLFSAFLDLSRKGEEAFSTRSDVLDFAIRHYTSIMNSRVPADAVRLYSKILIMNRVNEELTQLRERYSLIRHEIISAPSTPERQEYAKRLLAQ